MNKDDIIQIAREAGLKVGTNLSGIQLVGSPGDGAISLLHITVDELERFATLYKQHLLATDIHSCHPECQRFACVQARNAVAAEREAVAHAALTAAESAVLQAVAREREACAKVCEQDDLFDWADCAAAIRARGNT